MNGWQAALLGLLQGLTEFLPVSSSGHLVLVRSLWESSPHDLVFEVTVHLATLIAVVAYYRNDIATITRRLLTNDPREVEGMSARRWVGLIVLASVPAAVVGLLLKSQIEATFADPVGVGYRLLATGALLFSTVPMVARKERLGVGAAVLIGVAQAVAILPGISRSGATIVAAIWMGTRHEQAARFSFLLSLPAVGGAFLLETLGAASLSGGLATIQWPSALIGFVVALVSGYLAVALLIRALGRGKFAYFGIWCWAVGLWALWWFK